MADPILSGWTGHYLVCNDVPDADGLLPVPIPKGSYKSGYIWEGDPNKDFIAVFDGALVWANECQPEFVELLAPAGDPPSGTCEAHFASTISGAMGYQMLVWICFQTKYGPVLTAGRAGFVFYRKAFYPGSYPT